jgi:hypothetical protein
MPKFVRSYLARKAYLERRQNAGKRRTKARMTSYTGPYVDPAFVKFPHGQSVTKDFLFGDPSKTVCLVGNGPSILEKEKGSLIDSHDIVVRMNDFKAGGALLPYTGKKITIWVTGVGYQQPERIMGPRVKTIAWTYCPRTFVKRIMKKTNGRNVFMLVDHRALYSIGRRFGAGVKPSLGFSSIAFFKEHFTNPISIIGFDCNNGTNEKTISHYTGKVTKVGPGHDFAKENEIIGRWVKRGKIVKL